MRSSTLVITALLLSSCGTDPPTEDAIFPADYATTYQEVRNCRPSLDHDFMRIRVVASPDAVTPYMDRTTPFPTGALLVKEQFPSNDTACAGPVDEITVMQKLDVGADPDMLDWTWQKTDGARRPINFDLKRCSNCHSMCGTPDMGGYAGTCTLP